MITLYDCATAPSPRRARILLAEKGVAHETVQVDLKNAEQLRSAYQNINPLCTVPALRTEEGAVLTDNAAITAYLVSRHEKIDVDNEGDGTLQNHIVRARKSRA